jgi:hypothetical protein
MAVEREIEKTWDGEDAVHPMIGFDESETLMYFGSPIGIKIVKVATGELVRLIGKVENTERFL